MKNLVKTEPEADSQQVEDVLQDDSSSAMHEHLFEIEEAKIKHESDTEQPPDKQPTVQTTVEKVKCFKCWKRISKADMQAHQNWHLGLRPYKCERGCENLDFNSKQNQRYHYLNTHSGQQHECDICHKSFQSKSRLYYHKKGVHTPKAYVCSVCNKAFSTSLRLERHSKRHSERTLKCQQGCENLVFHCQQKRQQHYRDVHDRHECDICQKIYLSKKSLLVHKKNIHELKTDGCSASSCTSKTTDSLRDHTMYAHDYEKNHPCPKCNNFFGLKAEVDRHLQWHEKVKERMRSDRSITMKDLVKTEPEADSELMQDVLQSDSSAAMDEDLLEEEEAETETELDTEQLTDDPPSVQTTVKKVKCFRCWKKISRADMEVHQNWHRSLRPYKCERGCENVDFNSKQNRLYHYRNTHSGQQHECDICHKSFQSRSRLYYHIKVDHTPKTHVCPVCSKAFTTSTGLARHSKCHSVRERKHHCSLCTLSFFTKCNLKMHIQKHSKRKQRNHSCPKCNQSFCYKSEVTRHLQRHDKTAERMQSKRSITMKDLVETKPEEDSEQAQDDSSTAMDEDLFETEEAKIEPESDTEQPIELEDLFEAVEVKIEALEDHEQTADIKIEPKDVATSSTHH